jgi:hypothetical protein
VPIADAVVVDQLVTLPSSGAPPAARLRRPREDGRLRRPAE